MDNTLSAIKEEINKLKKTNNAEDAENIFLGIKEVKKLSEKFHYSIIKIEIIVLREGIIPARYQWNINSMSISEQIKLLEVKVTIIGCDGLGEMS